MIPSVTASEAGKAQNENHAILYVRIVIYRLLPVETRSISSLEQDTREGDSPVVCGELSRTSTLSKSRVVWDCSPKWEINFF